MSNIIEGFQFPNLNGMSRYTAPFDIDLIGRCPDPGLYQIGIDNQGWFITKQALHTDALIPLGGDSAVNSILKEIRKFLSPRTIEIMKDFGQVYRRGILMYGPPGSGKSSIVNLLIRELAESHKVITFLNPEPGRFCFIGKKIHELNPNQFMLVVYEDFENWTDDEDLLALLDGQKSVPNTMYLATTNYFEKLEQRIVDRPSRFATKVEVGAPSISVRLEFFKRHIPAKYLVEIDVNEWAEKTEGLMIDHLKHVAQYFFVFEKSLDEAVSILRNFSVTELTEKDND